MVDESLESSLKKHSNKHFLFENDNFDSTLINAIWLGRKMPTKR